jgi:hypothetical protein
MDTQSKSERKGIMEKARARKRRRNLRRNHKKPSDKAAAGSTAEKGGITGTVASFAEGAVETARDFAKATAQKIKDVLS